MSTSHNDRLFVRPYSEVDLNVPNIGMRMLPGRIALLNHPLNAHDGLHLAAGDSHAVWVCEDCGQSVRGHFAKCGNCGRENVTEARKSIGLATTEHMDPDICLVAESGVEKVKKGEVYLVKPDTGAYYPAPKEGWEGDKRELRIVGVASPWYECLLARLTEKGLEPMPGWSLIDREPVRSGLLETTGGFEKYGRVLSGEGEGEFCAVGDYSCYTFVGLPKSWALVKAYRSVAGFHAA